MKQIYFLTFSLMMAFVINAQTTIDLTTIDAAYTTTVDNELVIDLATTASTIAAPKLSMANPFLGSSATEYEISFDINNYKGTDSIKVLGAVLSIYDATLGRMYFTNGSYLGYNDGEYYDANLIDYGIGTDFLGGNKWSNVKLRFNATSFAVYVNNTLAYDINSTNITIVNNLSDQARVLTFLQNAQLLVFGTGSWWSDNAREDGTYFDAQFSYIKNIKFATAFSDLTHINQTIAPAKVIATEYFTISGAKVNANFDNLAPGIYIKREFLSNGSTISAKIGKTK